MPDRVSWASPDWEREGAALRSDSTGSDWWVGLRREVSKGQSRGTSRARSESARPTFGLIALRRGGIARAIVAVGSASLLLLYCAPLAVAVLQPGAPRSKAPLPQVV